MPSAESRWVVVETCTRIRSTNPYRSGTIGGWRLSPNVLDTKRGGPRTRNDAQFDRASWLEKRVGPRAVEHFWPTWHTVWRHIFKRLPAEIRVNTVLTAHMTRFELLRSALLDLWCEDSREKR
eukprot:887594-Rhodomonas_salina.1